jgi:predicted ATPase/class 3 adenylate cyclase
MSGAAQPSGTVTLVFTDIEGSTELLRALGDERYADALDDHRRVVRDAFAHHDGYEVDVQGDSFFYAFASAAGAVRAVADATAALEPGPIRIRIGVHTGEPRRDPPTYIGLDVHKAARTMAAAHGGQVLLSETTRALIDPSEQVTDLGRHRLKDMGAPEHLFQLGPGSFPPPRSLFRANLPSPPTAFSGRQREVEEIAGLLRSGSSLVTLTGSGGSGKTRLALEAASEVADAFPDGLWWVPLASLEDPAFLVAEVAGTLEIAEEPGRALLETLRDALEGRRALLLLDNVEHLLPGSAAPIAALRDIPGPVVLVTSRQRLHLAGERVYPVAPLTSDEAVELFLARSSDLGVAVPAGPDVSELCARLDNLPLAIELAAARTSLLEPGEILARLDDRLDRMSGPDDADPRQRTLRAAIDWSHALLAERERELFACLVVFEGGAEIESVEQVCECSVDTLGSLLDKSLVARGGSRVSMLETIREFALEQLDAEDASRLRDRHAAYYLALALELELDLRGPLQAAALERLDAESANLRVALRRLLEQEPEHALRLVSALWWYWWVRGQFAEGRGWVSAALEAAPSAAPELRAAPLLAAGNFAEDLGDVGPVAALYEEALACACEAGLAEEESISTMFLADRPGLRDDERLALAERSFEVARSSGDTWLLGLVSGNYASLISRHHLGSVEQVQERSEEALRRARAAGDASLTSLWLSNLGWAALKRRDTATARVRLEEALEIAGSIDDARQLGSATVNLAWTDLADGNHEAASRGFHEGLEVAHRAGRRALAAEALWGFALQAALLGRSDRADRLAIGARGVGLPADFDPVSAIDLEIAHDALDASGWSPPPSAVAITLDAAVALSSSLEDDDGP